MIRIKEESISMERLDGETILIDFESGRYYSFVGPGADILWLIENQIPKDSWPGLVGNSYPDFAVHNTFWEEIDLFIAQLLSEGIVVAGSAAETTEAVGLPDDHIRSTWNSPGIQINDELEDLLVIDPIHDSDSDGWPQVKQA